jgi:hypothetical protein
LTGRQARLAVKLAGATGTFLADDAVIASSPQSTRCSLIDISALPEFGPDLLECDRGKSADAILRQTVPLIDVLAVPSASEQFDNPRCFPAMLIKGTVELGARPVVSEPSTVPDMIAELAAKVIIKAALREAGKELARQCTEAVAAREPSKCTLHLFGWRRKFRFVIPVRRPDLWSSHPVLSALVETIRQMRFRSSS